MGPWVQGSGVGGLGTQSGGAHGAMDACSARTHGGRQSRRSDLLALPPSHTYAAPPPNTHTHTAGEGVGWGEGWGGVACGVRGGAAPHLGGIDGMNWHCPPCFLCHKYIQRWQESVYCIIRTYGMYGVYWPPRRFRHTLLKRSKAYAVQAAKAGERTWLSGPAAVRKVTSRTLASSPSSSEQQHHHVFHTQAAHKQHTSSCTRDSAPHEGDDQ